MSKDDHNEGADRDEVLWSGLGKGPRVPALLMITGRNMGHVVRLRWPGDTILGFGAGSDFGIDGDGVSRQHVRIRCTKDGRVSAVDLGSRSGTYCNGERFEERDLKEGDELQIGTTAVLRFLYVDVVAEELQRRHFESASRDPLTGCYNRSYVAEQLKLELSYALRHGQPLSVALCDVDHFQTLSQIHGKSTGDSVLVQIATAIARNLRKEDILGRYGADELIIVLRNTVREVALTVCERIRVLVEQLPLINDKGDRVQLTVTMGVTCTQSVGGDRDALDALLAVAMERLKAGKQRGRNVVE